MDTDETPTESRYEMQISPTLIRASGEINEATADPIHAISGWDKRGYWLGWTCDDCGGQRTRRGKLQETADQVADLAIELIDAAHDHTKTCNEADQ